MRMAQISYLFSLLYLLTDACETTIDTFSCQFYVLGSSDCSSFSFSSCSYTGDSNNQITHKYWNFCLYHCCGLSNAPQTYQTLSDCSTYNQQFHNMVIVSIVFGSLAVIVFLFILGTFCTDLDICWGRFKDRWCNSNRREERWRYNARMQQVEQKIAHDSSDNMDNQAQFNNEWETCYENESKSIRDTNCTICLSPDPSIMLKCGHCFHSACILTWINKRKACPLCNSTKMEPITAYCEKCFCKKKDSLRFRRLLECKPQLCQQCLA